MPAGSLTSSSGEYLHIWGAPGREAGASLSPAAAFFPKEKSPTSHPKSKSLLGILANGIFQHHLPLGLSAAQGGARADGVQQWQKEDKKDRKQGGNSLHSIPRYVQPRKAGFDFKPLGNTIIHIWFISGTVLLVWGIICMPQHHHGITGILLWATIAFLT